MQDLVEGMRLQDSEVYSPLARSAVSTTQQPAPPESIPAAWAASGNVHLNARLVAS